MKVKIKGKVFATLNEISEEVIVDLNNDNLIIEHNELLTSVSINGNSLYFENNTVEYSIIK